MKAYISGPMTGLPGFNYPAFDQAERLLRAFGFDAVVNPADYGREYPGLPWDDLVRVGCRQIEFTNVDIVVLLPGWETSQGALAEIAAANRARVPVVTFKEYMEAFTDAQVEIRRRRRDDALAGVAVFGLTVAALWPLIGTGAPVAIALWALAGFALAGGIVAARRAVHRAAARELAGGAS